MVKRLPDGNGNVGSETAMDPLPGSLLGSAELGSVIFADCPAPEPADLRIKRLTRTQDLAPGTLRFPVITADSSSPMP